MELVLGLGAKLVQRRNAARAGTDGQSQVVGALPGREGHAQGELSQDRGIDGIGLGAGVQGFSEVFGGLGVDDHDLESGLIQGQGQIKVILTGGLQADAPDPSCAQRLIRAACP